MKDKLYSIAKAAEAAGCSRRTIERALASGALARHDNSKGRNARPVALAEVKAMLAIPSLKAPKLSGIESRHESAPANAQVPLGWRGCAAMMILAAHRGACADLLATAVRAFHAPESLEYAGFCIGLLGGGVASFHQSAGAEIRRLSIGQREKRTLAHITESIQTFAQARRTLALCVLAAPFNVAPGVSWETGKTPSLTYFAEWVGSYKDANEGQGEQVESDFLRGSISIMNPRRNTKAISKAARKRAQESLAVVCAAANDATRHAIAFSLLCGALESPWAFKDLVGVCRDCKPQCPCASCLRRAAYLAECERLGVERQHFLNIVPPLRALFPNRGGSLEYNDSQKATTGVDGEREHLHPSHSEAAPLFGISRAAFTQMVGRIRNQTGGFVAEVPPPAPAIGEHCEHCGEPVTDDSATCPACGAML